MKAEAFDRQFDQGEDITEFLELSGARCPGYEPKEVIIDFPQWMLDALDREARRIGVTRQSIVKLWLAERLEQSS
ncbi:type II toxin-antitoxin system BrnA family antitoxin [Phormidesmis priestleyi]